MTMHDPKPAQNMPREAQLKIRKFAETRTPRARARKLGETLVDMGRMKPESVDQIVKMQANTPSHFGKVAKKLGLVTQEDVATALAVQHGLLREDVVKYPLPKDLVVVRRPSSSHAEEFRKLRTRLLTTKRAKQLRLMSIVSCQSHVDADYVQANLAASLAQLGRRTLLIDTDVRNRRMEKKFSVSAGTAGLSEVLNGVVAFNDARIESVVKNLSILISGTFAHSPQELLASGRFNQLLREARTQFDHVILGSAPFGKVADGELAWTGARSVLVVARRNRDRLKELKQLSVVLRQLNTDIVGSVLIK